VDSRACPLLDLERPLWDMCRIQPEIGKKIETMKNHSRKISLVAGFAVLAIAAVVILSPLGSKNVDPDTDEASAFVNPKNITSPRNRRSSVVARSTQRPQIKKENKIVKVSPVLALATVNRTEIRLEHLMPLRLTSYETVPMERSIFRSRLQRAIEAELIFQAASDAGIELTESQQRRLDQIAPKHESNLEELKPYGMSWDTLSEAQVSFERRMTETMMLRQNLVASTDAVAPSPDSETQAQYEQALQAMLDKLTASAVIETQDTH
jgi:hypothetical protein